MWSFKKKVVEHKQEAIAPRIYFDYTVVLYSGAVDQIKADRMLTDDHYHDFFTPDGWRAYKIDTVRFIECKKPSESKVVPINA